MVPPQPIVQTPALTRAEGHAGRESDEQRLLVLVAPVLKRSLNVLRTLAEASAMHRERLTLLVVGTRGALLPAELEGLESLGWELEAGSDGHELRAGRIAWLSDPELTRVSASRLARGRHEIERRAPLDALLSSIACDYGERAIVVLLAASEGDGIRGLQAIVQAGGTALALEDCSEARLAEAAGIDAVDELLSPTALGERVAQYLELPSADANALRAAVIDYFGLEADDYRVPLLARRVQRRMRVRGFVRPSEYTVLLQKDAVEAARVARNVLSRENCFLADPPSFAVLQQQVLPELLASGAERANLRAWVPGCATGEEAYSLTMVLLESIEQLGVVSDLRVFATDIDAAALGIARQGWYPREIEEDVSRHRLSRYFQKNQDGYRVSKRVRDCLLFATHRLTADPPFGKVDLISCHRLLGYLSNEQRRRALMEFHYALTPQGRVLVGREDVLGEWYGLFEPEDLEHGILRRVNRSEAVAATQQALLPLRAVKRPARLRPPMPTTGPSLEQELLSTHAPPLVVFDGRRNITFIAGSVGRYVQPPCGLPTEDVLAMTRPELRQQVAALLALPVESERSSQHLVQLDGEECLLELVVRPLERADPLYALSFHDRSDLLRQVAAVMRDEVPPPSTTRETGTLNQIQAEEFQNLQVLNEELWSQNQELIATNRELESSCLEQTSIREQHHVELAQLNEKIDELAREQAQWRELAEQTGIALLMLDGELRVQSFTPAALDLFRLIPADVGRPLRDIAHDLGDDSWLEDARGALLSGTRLRRPVSGSRGRCYQLELVPLRALGDRTNALALKFEDVSEGERARLELHARVQQLEEELDRTRNSEREPARGTNSDADQRLAHAERFAACIAHELNNPLGNIALAVDQAMTTLTTNNLAKTKELLLSLRDNAFRCGRIVESILRLARDEPAQHAVTGFNAIPRRAATIVRSYIASGKLRVAFALCEPDPELRCNATELEQVFVNLLSNAAHAHPRTCHVVIRSQVKGNELCVFVSDDGPGIAAADVSRIFEPFFSTQRKAGGTGLGLSITQRIVANHGGTISVSTAPGRGATFELRFPLAPSDH